MTEISIIVIPEQKLMEWPPSWILKVIIPDGKQNSEVFSMCMLSHFSDAQLFVTPWSAAHQAPVSMDSSKIPKWVAMPSSKGSWPGIEPVSPPSPTLQVDSVLLSHRGRPLFLSLQSTQVSKMCIKFQVWLWHQHMSPALFDYLQKSITKWVGLKSQYVYELYLGSTYMLSSLHIAICKLTIVREPISEMEVLVTHLQTLNVHSLMALVPTAEVNAVPSFFCYLKEPKSLDIT